VLFSGGLAAFPQATGTSTYAIDVLRQATIEKEHAELHKHRLAGFSLQTRNKECDNQSNPIVTIESG
jgi:hypothetical protein